MKLTNQNKLAGFILFVMMMFCSNVSAQDITASGTVVDAQKEPLIGASVGIVGGKVEAVTDIDGKFSFKCKQGATLNITYLGYTSQQVAAGSNLTIVMKEDSKTLDELTVVGVGYGQMRRSPKSSHLCSYRSHHLY